MVLFTVHTDNDKTNNDAGNNTDDNVLIFLTS